METCPEWDGLQCTKEPKKCVRCRKNDVAYCWDCFEERGFVNQHLKHGNACKPSLKRYINTILGPT